jgi:hypothetical protein
MRKWGPTAVVILLLAGTAIAFATTERQKLEKTPFDVLHVTTDFSPARLPATIVLRFRHPHLLTAQMVNSQDRVVATLVRERRYEPGKAILHWRGAGVSDGVYEPKLTLDAGRVFDLPNQVRVDSIPPRVALVSYRPRVLRKKTKPRVRISYRVSEAAHVILLVNGRRVFVGFAKALRAEVQWFAKRAGRRLPRGRYRLQLAAVDLAGNVGPRTPVFIVRIR